MPISPRIFTIAAVALLAGAAAPAAGAAPTGIYAQQAELAAADGATNDSFGSSVAVSGNTLVVGAPVKHGADDSAGAAYVYERPASGSWADAKQVAKLTLSGGRASGTLGHVAISGDTIVAGVGDQRVGTHEQQGAVFVFVRPTGGWADAHETAVLTASDGATSDVLGSGVAISGDTVVAGAEGKKVGDKERQGAAYVFVKPATGWKNGVQTAELAASSGATGDGAGNAVAISDDTIVLGSRRHDVGGAIGEGVAYVFAKPDSGWTDSVESAELVASDGAENDHFGVSVGVSGGTVAVGSFNHQVGRSTQQGAAYVFVRPLAGWSGTRGQTAELTASNGASGDDLGFAVGVSGDRVIASSPVHQVGANQAQGALYVFAKPGLTWTDATEADELSASQGTAGDVLGGAAAISSDAVVGGAAFRKVGLNDKQGAAYVFGLSPPSIAIDSPIDGASFTQGDAANASYSCSAPVGATITACAGPVASGSPLDTSTTGTHTFTVHASDSDGLSATRAVTYTVVPVVHDPGPRLSISGLRQTRSKWRTHGKRLLGTTFSFRLNQRARVTLHFTRRGRGAGTLRLRAAEGMNRVRFRGRIAPGKRLGPGRYALRITATNSNRESAATRPLKFTIVR